MNRIKWMLDNKKCPVCGKNTMGYSSNKWKCDDCDFSIRIPKGVKM